MSDLSLLLVKIGYLVLLWVFVLTVAAVMRRDLFPRRRVGRAAATSPCATPAQGRQARQDPARSTADPVRHQRGSLRDDDPVGGPTRSRSGRASDNTLVLDDDYASNYHARLRPYEGRWLVEDLGSTNGTYLDKQKVTSPSVVPIGVPVKVGKTLLELRK